MSTIRLLLDEDVWPGLAKALREQKYDALHVYELERGGLDDSEQLAYATQIGYAILTHNEKDFIPLAKEYFFERQPHAGIILSRQLQVGELLRRTLSLLQTLSAEEVANTVRYLADYK